MGKGVDFSSYHSPLYRSYDMDELLNELKAVAGAGFYSIALFTSLALPDICAALESDDGRASGARYKAWFDKWVAVNYPPIRDGRVAISGAVCYAYRCGLLHQGRSMHKDLGYTRVIFLTPGPLTLHNSVLMDALAVDIPSFVEDISVGVRAWIKSAQGTEPFDSHYANFMKRHRGGLAPYVVGVDLIS
jgi:hypothetical protein